MIRFPESLKAWGASEFRDVLKQEIEQLDADRLPLQQALSAGSHVQGDKFTIMILGMSEENDSIRARAGIFYTSIIAGCSCADDPTPVSELNEYCEVQLDIDKKTSETKVSLLPEPAEKAEF